MKKQGLLLLAIVAIVLLGWNNAFAQGDGTYYFVAYFSNANTSGAPDATLRIINDGDASTAQTEGVPNGSLYASIYTFDDSQEMQACCNCYVSPDGILSESVNKELTANTLTGRQENSRGVVKIISSTTNDPTNNVLTPGLRGWITGVQSTSNIPSKGPFYMTETTLAHSNLSAAEQDDLQVTCSFVITLGGDEWGICTCTLEDQDF